MQEKYTKLEHTPGNHRSYVGGVGELWDTIGLLQFELLKQHGLTPSSTLLDVGCGSLRLGVHAIPFLDAGNYYGIDMHQSLLDAGVEHELSRELAATKRPTLYASETFDVEWFGMQFDVVIAQSLFTHLPIKKIEQCVAHVANVLHKESLFFFTYYELSDSVPVSKIDEEPYHQPWSFYERLAQANGLTATRVGEWGHPRKQMLGCMTLC